VTRFRGVAVAAAAAALALPAGASAATVSSAGGAVTFTAASGESNRLSVFEAGGTLLFEDAGVSSMTAGPGCTPAGAQRVVCAVHGDGAVAVQLGDGNDVVVSQVPLPFGVHGGLGDDGIVLSAGNDAVDGGAGADTIDAGGGDDAVDGGAGADTLDAGGGDDSLAGGAGVDSLAGGAGADTLRARDGAAEPLACGSETDAVEADHGDAVDSDCEVVDRGETAQPTFAPVLPPDPTGGVGSAIEAPVAAISGASLHVTRAGLTQVRLRCPRTAFEGCSGSIVVEPLGVAAPNSRLDVTGARRVPIRLGTARFRALAGAGITVPVRLEPRVWRRLAARPRAKVRITVTMANATGATTSVRTVRVRRAG
jgi:hypothetical protein